MLCGDLNGKKMQKKTKQKKKKTGRHWLKKLRRGLGFLVKLGRVHSDPSWALDEKTLHRAPSGLSMHLNTSSWKYSLTFEYNVVAYPESNSLLEWDRVSNQVPKTSSKALSLTRREKMRILVCAGLGSSLKKVVSEMEPEPWGLVTPISKGVDASGSGTSWHR